MSSNAEETDPGFKTRAKRVGDKAKDYVVDADPWFDRGLDWLKGKWWTPIAVVIICLPFVWVMVKAILYVLGTL